MCSFFVRASDPLHFFVFNYLVILFIRTPVVPLRNYRISAIKKPNQMANRTLKQEMETDDDDATIRERLSLVQSILFIDFTDILPAHFQEKMVEKLWGNYAIWFGFFDNGLWRELMVSLVIFSESISSGQSVLIKI